MVKIINPGKIQKGRILRAKCACGCEFEFNEFEAIPVPQYGQHDELVLMHHKIRCPRCNAVVDKATNN